MGVFLIPLGLWFFGEQVEEERRKYTSTLQNQFKDAILSVAAAIKAGYAVENALPEAYKEMEMLYGKTSPIGKELYRVIQGQSSGKSTEILFEEMGRRSGLEVIEEFAEVFAIAKRSGGNLTDIIYKTASVIGDKIEIYQEIQVMLAARSFEQKIMRVIPFCIVIYIAISSPGYFDVLYSPPFGSLVMTICLFLYVVAGMLGNRIVQIQL